MKIYFAALFLATNKESFFRFGQKNKGGAAPLGPFPGSTPDYSKLNTWTVEERFNMKDCQTYVCNFNSSCKRKIWKKFRLEQGLNVSPLHYQWSLLPLILIPLSFVDDKINFYYLKGQLHVENKGCKSFTLNKVTKYA